MKKYKKGNYQNYDIKKLKELKTIKTSIYNYIVLALDDGRVLSKGYKGNEYPMLRVINIEKKANDICEKRYIKDMKKLDDGNILLLEDDLLKIICIEDNKIVELSELKGEGHKILYYSKEIL